MKKILFLLLLFIVSFWVKAQQVVPEAEQYGKIDTADLKMESCDFEKDAKLHRYS